jgi:Mg-chelatase subunit ChlD
MGNGMDPVLVSLVWEGRSASSPVSEYARLAEDAVALSSGQSKLVPFRAPAPGIAPGVYRLVLSIAGEPVRMLGFQAVGGSPDAAVASSAGPSGDAAPRSGSQTVTQALEEAFATHEGPEAAMAGIAVIGEFFDQALGPAINSPPASGQSGAPVSVRGAPEPPPSRVPSGMAAVAPSVGLDSPDAGDSRISSVDVHREAAGRPGVTVPLGGGHLQLVCARVLDTNKAPIDTPDVFVANDPSIYLAIRAEGTGLPDSVRVSWHALDVEGMPAGEKLTDTRTVLRSGAWRSAVLLPPDGGFWPGRYQARVSLDAGDPLAEIEFEIAFDGEAAELLDGHEIPSGINLAQSALGGHVVSATSEAGGAAWSALGLIDGFGYGGEQCKPSCGWASTDRRLPQELVFAFRDQRLARLKGIILDTQSCPGDLPCLQSLPRAIEVWISRSAADAGFELAARRALRPVTARHYIPLQDIQARFVKLVIRTTYGSPRRTQLAEVQILETEGPDSIVADVPIDLALPALGGSLVRYSSEHYRGKAARLLQRVADGRAWRSGDATLPQELTFSLHGNNEALIERIELDLDTGFDPATHPREIAVEMSYSGPLEGFAEVARVEAPAPAKSLTIPIGRMGRFIRLRLLSNHGGAYTSLGKVSIIEGRQAGYRSIIARAPEPFSPDLRFDAGDQSDPAALTVNPGPSAEGAAELELDRRIGARFSAGADRHYFGLTLPGLQPGMLTLELTGLPFLRAGLRLLSADGDELARFAPNQDAAASQRLSWHLEPGRYLLEAKLMPTDIVLAWDVSRSLAAHMDLLRQAVIGFIEHVGPNEALSLIAFNNEVNVLVEAFTNDQQTLLKAVEGQFKADLATRLFDTTATAIQMLSKRDRAGVVVIMTDGVDMGSTLTWPQFWEMLETNGARLFTLGLGGELQVFDPEVGISGGQLLRLMAAASGGRFIPIPTVDELVDVYRQIAAALMSGSSYALQASWTRAAGTLVVEVPTDSGHLSEFITPAQIELVLDASGSMKKPLGDMTRMEVAKRALVDLVETLPGNAEVALRVYGHRIREGRAGDCQDTELIHPFAPLDKQRLSDRIRGIQALGTTPIAYALAQTLGDFGETPGEKTVILVTDGEEECGGDLVQTVERLKAMGLDVRLHIVGFALEDPDVVAQLRAAADAGRGRYLQAADQRELKQAVAETLAPPYQVLDSAGRVVATGMVGQPLTLAAGLYRVVIGGSDGEPVEQAVRVDEGRLTRILLGARGTPEIVDPSATDVQPH